MPLIDVLTYRGIAAGSVLLALHYLTTSGRSRRAGTAPSSSPTVWYQRNAGLLIGIFLYAPHLLFFYTAFEYIETSLAVALGYFYPTLVLFIVAGRRGELPSLRELGLALLALLGILALTNPGADSPVNVIGIALVFVAASFFAVYVVAAGVVVGGIPPLLVGSQVSFGVAAAVAIYGIFTGGLGWPTSMNDWSNLGIQTFMLVMAIGAYLLGLSRLGAGPTSLIDSAQPLVAVLVGGFLLGEHLSPVQVFGVILVTVSVGATTLVTQGRRVLPSVDMP